MIHLGTSGFSYPDWKGRFYPEGLTTRDMLAFYARFFHTCEINATYYRMPTPATVQIMMSKVSPEFLFVFKTHQSMTHARTAGPMEYRTFLAALQPLIDQQRLGAVLAQFPYSFNNSLTHRGYLADLKARFPDVNLVVEFRNRSWDNPDVDKLLLELKLGCVNVDEPDLKGLVPPTSRVTSPVGYIRFHGRNAAAWYKKDAQPWERYNYLYARAELETWVPRIRTIAQQTAQTFVFFNNHWQSQAVRNAGDLAELLELPLPSKLTPLFCSEDKQPDAHKLPD